MKYYLFGSEVGASVIVNPQSLSDEQIIKAVILDELPIASEQEGFYSQINCNNETKEVWFDYFPIPVDLLK